jgi:hypothetical protein
MINYPPAVTTGVARVTGHALTRLLISDDIERHTPGDLLQSSSGALKRHSAQQSQDPERTAGAEQSS